MTFRGPLLSLLWLAAAVPAAGGGGQRVAAVLSSPGGAYLDAFSAFQAAYGSSVPSFDASKGVPELPPGTRIVVTFGTRAASAGYPPGVRVVYAMAPGLILRGTEPGGHVKIRMDRRFAETLAVLKRLQPGLRKLRVFWAAPGYADYWDDAKAAGAKTGVTLTPVRVRDMDDLPGLLRAGLGKMDAFWLPPDPLLITPESLMIFRQFSWDNGIPMYASTKGLTREGACASVGVSFSEMGAAAARTVLDMEAGRAVQPFVFPARTELTLNSGAARRCGIALTDDILRQASNLFP